MGITLRVFLGFFLLSAAVFYLLIDSFREELRPRYLEAVEESLNDTAHVLAALVEARMRQDRPEPADLERAMKLVAERRIAARIYGYTKESVDLDVYVTDARGIVRFDSAGRATGQDYSRWNDVYLTLRGRYGARSTRTDEADPGSSVLHVGAPIRARAAAGSSEAGAIVGVLTVYKPVNSIEPFIALAQAQIVEAGVATVLGLLTLGVIISVLITRPLIRFTRQVRELQPGERLRPPALAGPEIKDLALAFEELRLELEGARTVETYVQSLTHEIKSPLAAIRAASELLEEDMPADQRKRFFANIQRETERITDIVERLLALAALENRSGLEGVEKISLNDFLNELAADFAPEADRQQLTFEVDGATGLSLEGERFLIRQALANLVQNAIDFSSPGGRIRLAAKRRADDRVELSVTDEGPGLPDYAREKVFDRFYSLPRPDSDRKSSGLGLSFVKEIAALHGGQAFVENRAIEGTGGDDPDDGAKGDGCRAGLVL